MADQRLDHRATAIRRFNRLYTRKIGILDERFLDSAYPLAALRVVFELAHREHAVAADLSRALDLDPGYMSRLVRRLRRDGVIQGKAAAGDRRRMVLSLTERGRSVFDAANARSQHDTTALLHGMSEQDQRSLVDSLETAGRLLGFDGQQPQPPVILRSHQPGDMGWVVHAHGSIYAREYACNATFEAQVAEIVASFLHSFDPAWERCWIAERAGTPVGSVFVVKQDDEVAKLRLLLVDPSARGTGLGRTLVKECIRFAREAGYQRLVLWTTDVLVGARRIYTTEGFRMIDQSPYTEFGPAMIAETWELEL